MPDSYTNNENVQFVNPILDEQIFIPNLRLERNKRLKETDWTIMENSPLSDSEKQEYIVYRQALRDLPENSTYPDISWPVKPS